MVFRNQSNSVLLIQVCLHYKLWTMQCLMSLRGVILFLLQRQSIAVCYSYQLITLYLIHVKQVQSHIYITLKTSLIIEKKRIFSICSSYILYQADGPVSTKRNLTLGLLNLVFRPQSIKSKNCGCCRMKSYFSIYILLSPNFYWKVYLS